MKILYVITGLGRGGAERVVCDLADQMLIQGNQVKIVYLTGDVKVKPHNDIELIGLNLHNLYDFYNCYKNFRKIIISFKPDVVHSHMIHANLLARLVRLTCPINKLICTAHSNNEGGKFRMYLYRITHNLADLTTNVSNDAKKSFELKKAVPIGGIETIYNGIDLNKYFFRNFAKANIKKEFNLSDDTKILLAVGRFDKAKDYPTLLTAISTVKNNSNLKFKLLIAGDGELRSEIENLILSLQLESNIILLGHRMDIPELMSAADLFIISSKYEGFGLVVAEAMACECLVVGTDCGGVAEILDDENLIVPVNDSLGLSNKINDIMCLNIDIKNKIIKKNKLRVEKHFSLKEIIKKWEYIYNV